MKEKIKEILESDDFKEILCEVLKYLKILNRLYEIFKNNIINIILIYIYFMITWKLLGKTDKNFWITVFIYFIPLIISLSSLGEAISRYFNKVRELETSREKNYLIPLFDDVYEKAKNEWLGLNKKIEICIIDVFQVNSLSLGEKTIAVTKGAIETLSEEDLKGLIAHEIGHMANCTQETLFIVIAEKIFNILIGMLKGILEIFENMNPQKWYFKLMVGIIKLFLKMVIQAVVIVMQITKALLAFNSRLNEYSADKFAYEIGYGRNLINALYILESSYISSEPNIMRSLNENHSILPKRIGRLETLIDSEESKQE